MPAHLRHGWTMWRQAMLALLLLVLLPATAQADPAFPKFTNFVVDQAEVIPKGAEHQLNQKLATLQRRTQHQLVVATVASLQGYPINEFSLKLANSWGVGRRGYDDGVLLLVAPGERRVRIEVGYGLETTLTDLRCAAIIRDQILPRFRAGDISGGISAGADAIVARLDRVVVQKRRAS